jgi:uncharacterized membrane protein
MKTIYRPTVLTLLGFATTIAAIAGTTGYVLGRAPSLPPMLAVHFDDQAIADRFVQTTYPIVLVPVWIQLTLTIVFGAMAGVLLHRTHKARSAVEDEQKRQDRERMLMTAEAISLLGAIWVAFQGLLAIRLFMMWQSVCCGLGSIYYQILVVCIVLSAIVAVRAGVYLKHPKPVMRSTDDAHWRLRDVYINSKDPALFVPLRSGVGWTINFGRPQAVVFVAVVLFFGIWGPLRILWVLIGE